MAIKSFRGQLADLKTVEINLRTNDGSTGYKINKFELFPSEPGITKGEAVVKIFSTQPPSASLGVDPVGTVNFEDQDLLAAAYLAMNDSAYYGSDMVTVFENIIFNQNIWITHKDSATGVAVNYYLELEQIKLNDNESTMTTLQSIRSRYEAYTPAGPS